MDFQLLIRAFVGGIVLILAITVYVQRGQNSDLRTEITEMRAASDRYKKTIEQKIAQTEKEYEQDKTDIDSRYNGVINRLRKQKSDNVRTPTTAQTCEGKRDTETARVQSELLRRLTEVSRYADQLRVTAEKCEKIN
jgi:Tfp pilus assembly major pilin PilA